LGLEQITTSPSRGTQKNKKAPAKPIGLTADAPHSAQQNLRIFQ
jgi:hypothetical protein